MIHRIASTCLAVIAAISCFAYQAAMGQWRIHAAHTGITRVAQTENKIYGITGGALFSIDKNDNSLEMHSKLTGLSDSDISHIFYSEYTKKLMIVYSNSNIDLISDDYEMVNISDIYRKTFNGEKNINDVFLYNNVAYLATGFGIIVLNMEKYEIADTYTIGNDGSFENIVGIGIAADHIYALGDETLKYAGTKGVNLSNYNNWKEIDIPEPTVANRQLEMVGDTVFIVKANNNLYKYIDNAWSG